MRPSEAQSVNEDEWLATRQKGKLHMHRIPCARAARDDWLLSASGGAPNVTSSHVLTVTWQIRPGLGSPRCSPPEPMCKLALSPPQYSRAGFPEWQTSCEYRDVERHRRSRV